MTTDLVGKTFGRLTVISLGTNGSNGGRRWNVVCSCGNTRLVAGGNLQSGGSTSCGCYKSEVTIARLSKGFDRKAPEYRSWAHMKSRCDDVNDKDYDSYGGRGIKYIARWADYAVFLADMGPKPSPKHELDRRNNELGYSKRNCKWSTRTEQNRNKRNTKWVILKGKKISLAEAALAVGENYDKLRSRIDRRQFIGFGITLGQ